jgi:serine/threonine protein kinase
VLLCPHPIHPLGEMFSEDDVMEWFVQICMALCYLHKKRCIHRDLKPHNIFLTSHRRIVKARRLGVGSGRDWVEPFPRVETLHCCGAPAASVFMCSQVRCVVSACVCVCVRVCACVCVCELHAGVFYVCAGG